MICLLEVVKISPNTVRKYLVSGDGNVTDEEVMMFMSLCRYQHLNPFLKEAYLIKFGNSPATIVTGKDVFTKRARRNKDYAGKQAGIIVLNEETNEITEREGTFYLPNEKIVGGWAKVFIKGYSEPEYVAVSFDEYAGKKKDGTLNSNWSSRPGTMIRKVALVQALREAFPEEMSSLYDASEMDKAVLDKTGQEIVELESTPIEAPTENAVETPVQVVEAEKVITPSQTPATPVEAKSGGQGSIDDIMFGS